MLTPEADIPLDVGTVAALVAAQHPDLLAELRLVADGWDNSIYRLGDRYAVRLPRRQVAAQLIVNEQTWLPRLAMALSIAVPEPVRVGVPTAAFPWPWSIVRWFDGIDGADVSASERAALAVPLAEFVVALHSPAPHDEPVPHNPVRGVPLSSRDASVHDRLAQLVDRPEAGALADGWERALAAPPWAREPIWLHGDLHPGNLVLSRPPGAGQPGAALAAVIDFGDLTAGDPATDLATAWLTFDAEARAVFRARIDELTDTDEATWQRARGWAIALGTALALHSDDNPRMAGLGRHALEQLSGA
ncbi:aminoglycoside phosphotransferase family protein [Leifsonia poae]|uniref:aminoglycoside phosphotransferase family protein n=1 Tax=Leifsonia poae TaxID=110933 RepID=UPI0027E21422|nr:aminoglycoside phosphotransferase family protein [Leifsonia poae]